VLKQSVRGLAGKLLRSQGYQVFRSEFAEKASLTTQLQRILRSQHVDCVLDVGANRGQFYQYLRKEVGYQGRILSFEPIAALADALRDAARRDQLWTIYPFALGASDESATFNIMRSDDLSSFRTPTTLASGRFSDSNTVVRQQTVQVRSLDSLMTSLRTEHNFSRPYLKLDTQGYDLAVAEGAKETLQQFVAVQSEASVLPLYDGMPSYKETIAYFENLGLVLSLLSPISWDDKFQLIEFDCVFVNPARMSAIPVSKR
jgi:FkbM family methyltransferase